MVARTRAGVDAARPLAARLRLDQLLVERAQELALLLTLEGSVLRIESKATIDNLEYTLAIIADRESGDQIARIAQ